MRSPDEVKEKIKRLVEAGANESDIDEFVRLEGYTAETLRNAQPLKTKTPTFSDALVGNVPPDIANQAVPPAPTEEGWRAFGAGVGTGAADIYSGIKQLNPFLSPEESNKISIERQQEREQFQKLAEAEGQGSAYGLGRMTPQALLALTAARYLPSGAKLPIAQRFLYAGGTGAGLNMMNPTLPEGEGGDKLPIYSMDAETKLGQAFKGAVGGLLFQSAAEGIGAAGKLLPSRQLAAKSELKDVLSDPARRNLLEKSGKLEKEFGGKFSASERGLGEGVRAAENELAGIMPETFAKRRDANLNNIISQIKSMTGTGTSDDAAKALSDKTISRIESLKGARVPEFDAALQEAHKVSGGQRVIDINPVRKGILEEIKEIRKAKNLGDEAKDTIKYLVEQYRKFPKPSRTVGVRPTNMQNIDIAESGTKLIRGNDNVDVLSAQSLLRDATIDSKTTGGILSATKTAAQRRGGNIIKSLLDDAVNKSAEKGVGAAKILKDAREKYAQVMDDLAEIQSTPLGSVLDRITKKRGVISSSEISSAWKRSTPEQRDVIQRLLGNDKEIIKSLQSAWFDDVLEKATKPVSDELGRSAVDTAQLLKEWKPDKRFIDLFSDDPKRLAKLLRAREYLNRITVRGSEKAAQGITGQAVEQFRTGTGLSSGQGGSKVFLGGIIGRRILPSQFKRLLLTDEGIDALMKAANPKNFNPAEVAAAGNVVNRILSENEE